jgi:hypothetical protein
MPSIQHIKQMLICVISALAEYSNFCLRHQEM